MATMTTTTSMVLISSDPCAPLHYALDNITRYVFDKLGERCAMPSIVWPTAVIYGGILLLGLVGNLCTCLVILRNRAMHNPTNYYLFSLAISDLLVLVLGLPMELYGVFDVHYPYKFGEHVCKGRAFLIEFTSYASILTITCFSVERWLAICFPLRVKLFSTLDRAVRVIIAVWLCAFLAASPVLSIVVVNKLPVPDWALGQQWLPLVSDDGQTLWGTDTCAMDFRRPLAQRRFIFAAFFLFFLLPAVLITLVYCHIVHRLCWSGGYTNKALQAMESGAAKQSTRSRKSVLKILVSVVVMFFLCWLPFHVQRLLSVYLNESAAAVELDSSGSGSDDFASPIYSLFTVVFYISGYCYYSNSACNPILYNILSAKYRMAFCKTILGKRLTYKLLRGNRHYYSPALAGCQQQQWYSAVHSKWSNGSGQYPQQPQHNQQQPRWSSSAKLSSTVVTAAGQQQLLLFGHHPADQCRIIQRFGESALLAACAAVAGGVPLLLDARSGGGKARACAVRQRSLRRSQRTQATVVMEEEAGAEGWGRGRRSTRGATAAGWRRSKAANAGGSGKPEEEAEVPDERKRMNREEDDENRDEGRKDGRGGERMIREHQLFG